ncbi:MAG: class II aldolase [Hyphomonadaceae bacterium]|nr:class II aldolase [Hyphomonadaceae bacterium]
MLSDLARVTAEIGRDALLTQGAGGNTSVKIAGELWIKASGAWMRDAETQPTFVAVPLDELVEVARNGDEGALRVISAPAAANGLRPSVEAVVHAIMPHRAVIHAHAINSTVCAVLGDGEARFTAAMAGLGVRSRYVPYIKPGLPLAAEIARMNARDGTAEVLLLQNHGIVVGADEIAQAYALLRAVESALTFPVRRFSHAREGLPELERRAFEWDARHAPIACDAGLCLAVTAAPLTPDQVVFLGGAPCLMADGESADEAADRVCRETDIEPALVYAPGRGAMRRVSLSEGQRAQCAALAEVAARLPNGARVLGLTPAQARELIDWEAEKYRRAADAARR